MRVSNKLLSAAGLQPLQLPAHRGFALRVGCGERLSPTPRMPACAVLPSAGTC